MELLSQQHTIPICKMLSKTTKCNAVEGLITAHIFKFFLQQAQDCPQYPGNNSRSSRESLRQS